MGSCWDFGGPVWPFNAVLLGLLVSLWFFSAWWSFKKEAAGEIELIGPGQQIALIIALVCVGILHLVVDGSAWPLLAGLFAWPLSRGVGLLARQERIARATRVVLLLVALAAALASVVAATTMAVRGCGS